jgi:hypothetical protein
VPFLKTLGGSLRTQIYDSPNRFWQLQPLFGLSPPFGLFIPYARDGQFVPDNPASACNFLVYGALGRNCRQKAKYSLPLDGPPPQAALG